MNFVNIDDKVLSFIEPGQKILEWKKLCPSANIQVMTFLQEGENKFQTNRFISLKYFYDGEEFYVTTELLERLENLIENEYFIHILSIVLERLIIVSNLDKNIDNLIKLENSKDLKEKLEKDLNNQEKNVKKVKIWKNLK